MPTNVNITSLMDVLTVLLFFLIKSMSVTAVNLDTPKDVRLPASTIENQAEEAVVITLSANKITVDKKEILLLDKGDFKKIDIGTDSRTILPLKKLLDEMFKNRMAFYKDIEDVDKNNIPVPKVLIQADKELKFGTIKYMLHTVASSGYTDYQFIVIPSS